MPIILHVEDNDIFRELIRETIHDNFPEITIREAQNSTTALSVVHECLPDLIFMDINLRGESGLDLTKKIKKLYPGLEVIVLTAYDLPEFEEAALAAGASRVLVKSTMVEDDVLTILQSMISCKKKKD